MTIEEQLAQERKAAGESLSQQTNMPEYSSAADFDARITQMLADDERKEREKQERKIQRQQVAQGLADTWSIIGDTVKASQGALVTPRDVQTKYKELDERSQKVYDNYRARLDVIRQGIQARAKADRDAALAANMKAQERAAAEAEAQKERDLKLQITRENNASAERQAATRARYYGGGYYGRGGGGGRGSAQKTQDVYFNGLMFTIPSNSNVASDTYNYLRTRTNQNIAALVDYYTTQRIGQQANENGVNALNNDQKMDIIRDVLYSLSDAEIKGFGGTLSALLQRGNGITVRRVTPKSGEQNAQQGQQQQGIGSVAPYLTQQGQQGGNNVAPYMTQQPAVTQTGASRNTQTGTQPGQIQYNWSSIM